MFLFKERKLEKFLTLSILPVLISCGGADDKIEEIGNEIDDNLDEVTGSPPEFITTSDITWSEDQIFSLQLSATDPDGDQLEYHLSGGDDWAAFEVDVDTGLLTAKEQWDFENPFDDGWNNVYEVQVTVADPSLNIARKTFRVTLTNSNEAPSFDSSTALNATENIIFTHMLSASDPDEDDTLTYRLVDGGDSALFTVDESTGALSALNAWDYEQLGSANSTFQLSVIVEDSGGATATQVLTITLEDAAEFKPVVLFPSDNGNFGGVLTSVRVMGKIVEFDSGEEGADADAHGASVSVNGVAAELMDDDTYWVAEIPLTFTMENETAIVALTNPNGSTTEVEHSFGNTLATKTITQFMAGRTAEEILFFDRSLDLLAAVNVTSKATTKVSSNAANEGPMFEDPTSLALVGDQLLYVDDSGLMAVNTLDGTRSEISGYSVGTGPAVTSTAGYSDIVLTEDTSVAYVLTIEGILSVDLSTGDRSYVLEFANTELFTSCLSIELNIVNDSVVCLPNNYRQQLSFYAISLATADIEPIPLVGMTSEDLVGGVDLIATETQNIFLLIGSVHLSEINIDSGEMVSSVRNIEGLANVLTLPAPQGNYALSYVDKGIFKIDAEFTIEENVLSEDVVGNGPEMIFTYRQWLFDAENQRLIDTNYVDDQLQFFSVDITNGNRTLLMSDADPVVPARGAALIIRHAPSPDALLLSHLRLSDDVSHVFYQYNLTSQTRSPVLPVSQLKSFIGYEALYPMALELGAYDEVNQRILLVVDAELTQYMLWYSFATEALTLVREQTFEDNWASFDYRSPSLEFDAENNQFVAASWNEGRIELIDLDSGEATVIASEDDGKSPYIYPNAVVAFDYVNDRVLSPTSLPSSIAWVDVVTGDRTIVSSADVGWGIDEIFQSPRLHPSEPLAYVSDGFRLYLVNLFNGDRAIVSQ